MARIDDFLAQYDANERHQIAVKAAPADALAAARAATPAEMPLVRALFALRSLPALVVRRGALPAEKDQPLAQQMVGFGFVPLAEADDELVLGFVGQPWKLSGGSMPRLRSAAEWSSFDEPGYVKAVMSFSATPHGVGSLLETETRIHATDPRSRARFARYWRLIRPGSGLVRRSWLGAAKRRAERAAGSSPR